MSRFRVATTALAWSGLLLLLLAVCCTRPALATELCLNGTAALVRSQTAPEVEFCNSVIGCDIRFELSFDTATMDTGRWPLRVQLADGLYLDTHFPELTDVAFQCDSGGDIIASTVVTDNSQRARLIWTYAGASSVSCEYVMQTVDLTTAFTSFEALLSYANDSGSASFDAMFSSTDPAYSIAALSIACPSDTSTTTTDTTGSVTTDTTTSTSDTTGTTDETSEVGTCRYPLTVWKSGRRYSAEWMTVAGYEPVCGISYKDLAYVRGDARSLPAGFLALAQQVVAVALNAAMYSVEPAQINDTTIAEALDVVGRSINCADTRTYDSLVSQLASWNNRTVTCAGGEVDTNQRVGSSSTCSDKRDAYLAWAISVTAVAGCLLLFIGVVVLFLVFRRISQRYPQLLGNVGNEIVRIGEEMTNPYSEESTAAARLRQQQPLQQQQQQSQYILAADVGSAAAAADDEFSGLRA